MRIDRDGNRPDRVRPRIYDRRRRREIAPTAWAIATASRYPDATTADHDVAFLALRSASSTEPYGVTGAAELCGDPAIVSVPSSAIVRLDDDARIDA